MTYCYLTEDGETHEIVMSVNDMEKMQDEDGRILLDDGRFAKRDFGAELHGERNGAWSSEMLSDAMGCHPSQVKEYEASLAKKGVPTRIHEDGRARVTSREHRNQLMKALNLFDKSAGYGDRTPRHYKGDGIDREQLPLHQQLQLNQE